MLINTNLKSSCFNRELQQRIPNETLSGLASALADGPIFEIVDGLTEVQQAVEKQLFRQRFEVVKRHTGWQLVKSLIYYTPFPLTGQSG